MAKIQNIALCANNLNRFGNFRHDKAYIEQLLQKENAKFILFCEDQAANWFEQDVGGIKYLSHSDIFPLLGFSKIAFAGIDDEETPYFLVSSQNEFKEELELKFKCVFSPLRTNLMAFDDFIASVLGLGVSLFGWHKNHEFCAKCGSKSDFAEFGFKRLCPSCGAEHFPRTDPVAITLVIHDDKCLFARSKLFPAGLLSLPAGFVEPGESIEQACAREVFEETGIKIEGAELLASQPWPNYSQIMVGLKAIAQNSEIILDTNEMVSAHWLNKSQTRQLFTKEGLEIDGEIFHGPRRVAIAYSLIKHWLKEK